MTRIAGLPKPRLVLGLLAAAAVVACATSPTGRAQLTLFPQDRLAEMGEASYAEIRKQSEIADDATTNRHVDCVARAIVARLEARDRRRDWEVTVFEDDTANAFALPGGKIGVHTGLLDVARNQHQLATVIAHEVAHVLARHANERVSQQFAVDQGLQILQAIAGQPTATKERVFAALGVGAQVGVLLPFSRAHESEADVVGLDLMARAGFDPRESVALWQNMARAGSGQPPEFLSTHPSHATRIDDLRSRMDKALQAYRRARAAGRRPDCG